MLEPELKPRLRVATAVYALSVAALLGTSALYHRVNWRSIGARRKLIWIDAPGWLIAATYVAVGWIALVAMPELVARLGAVAVAALALGGVLYSTGAVIYARKRPDPPPTVFGYHELSICW